MERVFGSRSGFYSTIELPGYISINRFLSLLKSGNVWVYHAAKQYLLEYRKTHVFRLSVSQVEDEWIEEGVKYPDKKTTSFIEAVYCAFVLHRSEMETAHKFRLHNFT